MSFVRQAVRGYATAAAKASLPVTPPGLAGKYAGALFSAASKGNSKALSQVETDVKALKTLIRDNKTVAAFITNPTLGTAEKAAGMKDVLSKLGNNTSDLTKNFLAVLAENGRLYETDKVVEGFEQIMSAYRGELQITITSAQELDKATLDKLKKVIESSKISKEYKSVNVSNKVQPDLLAGLIVDFGDDKTVDLSAKSRVQKLERPHQPIPLNRFAYLDTSSGSRVEKLKPADKMTCI